MGAGHLATALYLQKAAPRLNAGILIFAAILADILLGIFVLLGWEEVHVPYSFAVRHYFEFSFPYSHGLLATILWSAAAIAIARFFVPMRAALIVGAAVFSHFVLDALVHVPELPVTGEDSYKIGFSLWNHLGVELTLEAVMVVVALVLFRRRGMTIFMAIVTIVMIASQATVTTVPSTKTLAITWIAGGIAMSGIAYLLDRRKVEGSILNR